jgi:hypothetical protein
MNELNHLRLFRLKTVFDGARAAAPSRPEKCAEPDRVSIAQDCLRQLERELGIGSDKRAQWTLFARSVLLQVERVSLAREAACNSAASDPAHAELKRELIRQVIATPELLSHAARDLYVVLTPDQQRRSGEKLLKFHRQLLD